jgi:hypothetical protein
VAGLVAQETLAHTPSPARSARTGCVNIVVRELAHTESGVFPVPLYLKSGTCVLPITITSAASIRSTAASSS